MTLHRIALIIGYSVLIVTALAIAWAFLMVFLDWLARDERRYQASRAKHYRDMDRVAASQYLRTVVAIRRDIDRQADQADRSER